MTTKTLNDIVHRFEKSKQHFVGNCVFLRSFYDAYMCQEVLVFWLNGKEVRCPVYSPFDV